MATFGKRLMHAWNAFVNEDKKRSTANDGGYDPYYGPNSGYAQDRRRLFVSNERSILASIYTRLSIDVAAAEMRHVRLDEQNRYLEDIDSGLNECLTVAANIDQEARELRQDIAITLFDKGCAAIVPVDTNLDPMISGGYDIKTLRVGDVVSWYPQHVKVHLYDENVGIRKDVTLEKRFVAIVDNPLFPVMNETNSTLQRVIRKLNLLDFVDEAISSGKLDLIIQLPYVIKSEARRQQAEQRSADIEFQLRGSKHGIAYTDGTEKITQLNRPAENNLMAQIEYLMALLYSQLGLTEEVMNGTADEAAMLNYRNRTIVPVCDAIQQSMKRSFLTKTARAQKQSVEYFIDPFNIVPMSDLAEMADKFTRNEIFTSNEIRQFVGVKPSKDPKADQLVNSNMPQAVTGVPPAGDSTGAAFDEIDKILDDTFKDLGVNENVS